MSESCVTVHYSRSCDRCGATFPAMSLDQVPRVIVLEGGSSRVMELCASCLEEFRLYQGKRPSPLPSPDECPSQAKPTSLLKKASQVKKRSHR